MGLLKVLGILSIVVIIIIALSPLFKLLTSLLSIPGGLASLFTGMLGVCIQQDSCQAKKGSKTTYCFGDDGTQGRECSSNNPCSIDFNPSMSIFMVWTPKCVDNYFAIWGGRKVEGGEITSREST